jgi:DNA-binding transcriptional regulator YiaG
MLQIERNTGGGKIRMNLRFLRIPALLILAFSVSSHAQSLGDVARQFRAERQQSGWPSHPKVFTNDDIQTRASAAVPAKDADAEQDVAKDASQDGSGSDAAAAAKSENSGDDAKPSKSAKAGKGSANTREERELATDKRTEEMNQAYLTRIAAIRTQIGTTQQELAKLQVDQVESTNEYRRSLGTSPNVGTYAEQQSLLNEQIQAHRDLLNTLSSQLEDAEEAARHAGVPHPSD